MHAQQKRLSHHKQKRTHCLRDHRIRYIHHSECLHNVCVCWESIYLYKWPTHAVSRVCVLCAHNNNKTSARKIRPNVDMCMCVFNNIYILCIVLICFIYMISSSSYLCIYILSLFYFIRRIIIAHAIMTTSGAESPLEGFTSRAG